MSNIIHTDDGELLDKEGKPMDSTAHGDATWSGASGHMIVEHAAGPDPSPALIMEPPPPKMIYRCDATTCNREMDAWEMMQVLNLMFGGLSIDLEKAKFDHLPPDVKRHFRGMVL